MIAVLVATAYKEDDSRRRGKFHIPARKTVAELTTVINGTNLPDEDSARPPDSTEVRIAEIVKFAGVYALAVC
jgi:hypothetical protein